MANLNFSTESNYQKIVQNGTFDTSVANPDSQSSTTITHDLGYTPNCRVWFTNAAGLICPAVPAGFSFQFTDFSLRACSYQIYANTLVIIFSRGVTTGMTVSTTIYYRIYLDAA